MPNVPPEVAAQSPTNAVLPQAIADRFSDGVAALTGGMGRIGLAVSGGADSLALLLLAHQTMPDWIAVATVNHGLRDESKAEATFVAGVCHRLGVRHATLTPPVPIAGSLQSAARVVRYELLADWASTNDLAWIATAHHIEDQAETLMMRLARGSGVAGLSAIRARNDRVIRPLLGWRRADLHAVVATAGLEPVSDPSNENFHFDRVRMRRWFLSADAPDAQALATSAGLIAAANEALDWSAEQAAMRRMTADDHGVALDTSGLPTELCRRLTLMALRQIAPEILPRGAQLSVLIDILTANGRSTLGGVVCTGGTIWHFAAAPPRANQLATTN